MQGWKGWPLERLMYLFLGIAFAVVWAQIYLFHGVMAEFEESPMRIPVYFTPLVSLAAFMYAGSRNSMTRGLFITLFSGGLLTGLMGVYYHLHGVQEMGGLTIENLAVGPPVLLPLTYAALALLGVAVALWPVKLTAVDFEEDYGTTQEARRYRGRTPA